MPHLARALIVFLCVTIFLSLAVSPSRADAVLGAGAEVTASLDAAKPGRTIPPGAVGWGAMWKRDIIWPAPPKDFTDKSHADYIVRLGHANAPLVAEADMRNVSWPWGVSFSTYAVNWENSARPWSKRPADCARILNRIAPWCEKTIVGVGDLMTLAHIWRLEAITVSVPLAVIDGRRTRWGPGFLNHTFSDHTIGQISDHARLLVDYMKQHAAWKGLKRVYISAGCEWRHYKFSNPSPAVLSYARLVKAIRAKIPDKKVIIVASASDSADIPGIKAKQAENWNRYLYRELKDVAGVALDLHRYRGMVGASAGNAMPMTPHNIDVLLKTGRSQRDFLTVRPQQWGASGKAAPSVLLENAVHGRNGDHAQRSDKPRPWPVDMAHADLVREALASDALTFLGWTWFPENLPPEWPHGAIKNGKLTPHAKVQAFLSRYHRGRALALRMSNEKSVRANAVRGGDGVVRIYGGNFSRSPSTLAIAVKGADASAATVETMTAEGVASQSWDGDSPLRLPAMSLFRVRLQ
jgi:hypothetical protein